MSRLTDLWLDEARESIGVDPCDAVLSVETADPRIKNRKSVVGGAVVDGRAVNGRRDYAPGLVIAALTSDDHWQECGISHVEQARVVMRALLLAWPELRAHLSGPCK